jgi:hypothetical protein
MVLFIFGLSCTLTGLYLNKYGHSISCYRIVRKGCYIAQAAAVASILTYFSESLLICFITAGLWGVTYTLNQSNLNSLVSIEFKNNSNAFVMCNITSSFVIVLSLLVGINVHILIFYLIEGLILILLTNKSL